MESDKETCSIDVFGSLHPLSQLLLILAESGSLMTQIETANIAIGNIC